MQVRGSIVNTSFLCLSCILQFVASITDSLDTSTIYSCKIIMFDYCTRGVAPGSSDNTAFDILNRSRIDHIAQEEPELYAILQHNVKMRFLKGYI